MFEAIRISSESLIQGNILHQQEISTLSFEHLMLLFLNDEVDIPSFATRYFISHSTEGNLLIMMGALFDVYFDDLAFVLGLGRRSLPLAISAGTLHLSEHSGAYLTNFHDGTLASTSATLLTFSNNDFSIDSQLDRLSIVKVFQRHLDGMLDARTLAWARSSSSSAASAAEEHAKQVLSSCRRGAAFIFDSLQTILVVDFPFLGVAQNFICGIDFFEEVFISSLIGVVFNSHFTVRLFDFFLIGTLVNTQNFI
mmetsp:Transcript_9810/g.27920  ORF Transcript_9810/g.27920 Transcript_9810/m.27920 type:complete len:253 (-) Transcript_9810:247-1005(-)